MTSRVARMPIELPKGVEVIVQDQLVTVKGGKGTMQRQFPSCVGIHLNGGIVNIDVKQNITKADAQAGTARALISNMVKGVSVGFERKLTLVGVGYRANAQGKVVNLALGFSHPVNFPVPEGITIETPTQTEIIIKGADKHMVGQVAANIRAIRPPEPYKGKGVRYADEVIILKETKKK